MKIQMGMQEREVLLLMSYQPNCFSKIMMNLAIERKTDVFNFAGKKLTYCRGIMFEKIFLLE